MKLTVTKLDKKNFHWSKQKTMNLAHPIGLHKNIFLDCWGCITNELPVDRCIFVPPDVSCTQLYDIPHRVWMCFPGIQKIIKLELKASKEMCYSYFQIKKRFKSSPNWEQSVCWSELCLLVKEHGPLYLRLSGWASLYKCLASDVEIKFCTNGEWW